jgi:hypothetical protein
MILIKLIKAVGESVDQIIDFDNGGLDAAGLAVKNGQVRIESQG